VSFFGERVTLRRVRFFGGRCGWDFGGDCVTGDATLSSLDSPMYIRRLRMPPLEAPDLEC